MGGHGRRGLARGGRGLAHVIHWETRREKGIGERRKGTSTCDTLGDKKM